MAVSTRAGERPRLQRISRQLQRRGIVAVIAARMLPVGNFSLINMTAGALGVRFRDYLIGNAIGLLPGVLALTVFADRIGATVRHPHANNLIVLALVAGAIGAALWWLKRRIARRRDGRRAPAPLRAASPRTTFTSASAETARATPPASRPCCARSTPTSSASRRSTRATAIPARRCRCSTSPRRSATTRSPGPTLLRPTGHYGNALLTRRPVLDVRHLDLTVYRREPRAALDVDLDIDGVTVRVVVTHLGLLPGERRTQVRRLLDLLGESRAGRRGPLRRHQRVVRDRTAAALAARAPRTDGGRGNVPAAFPVFALDRIWVNPRMPCARPRTPAR